MPPTCDEGGYRIFKWPLQICRANVYVGFFTRVNVENAVTNVLDIYPSQVAPTKKAQDTFSDHL